MAERGRPFQPGNTFGRGRPRGSRNNTTLAAQELLARYAEPLVRKCVQMAASGDHTAMRLVIERILPARRDMPVNVKKLRSKTVGDIAHSMEQLLSDVSAGKLSPN